MNKKINNLITYVSVISLLLSVVTTQVMADRDHQNKIVAKGMVTMLDIGAVDCVPCTMMTPILEELESEYKNKAAIVHIDAYEKPAIALELGVNSIPTQIFYDPEGKEVKRHIGFMKKKEIIAVLRDLGVK